MSLETRSSAHFKRAEQLRRWEDSETNREPTLPKSKSNKVRFSSSCVFLAACTAGDKDEVLNLLQKGIDINTANVDGLTALHQACIEDNLEMVEFLVQNGADVNLGDNEGWTPLHATASCGFRSIAKYLIDNGADVAAVNNDGDLAIDIAESDDMEELLKEEVEKRGIDCEKARVDEQQRMFKDAHEWAAGNNTIETIQVPHQKTGATALHIAAAKGYIDVMQILLQHGLVDVDQQDYDGWTPLHAAAHWGQREAAKLLVDNFADLEIKNYYRQTPFDVADPNMLKFMEDLKQSSLNREIILGKRQAKRKAEAPAKIKKVELQIEKDKEDKENEHHDNEAEIIDENVEKKNRVNAATVTSPIESNRIISPPPTTLPHSTQPSVVIPSSEQNVTPKSMPIMPPPKTPPSMDNNSTDDMSSNIPSWRRPASIRTRLGADSPTKSLSLRIGEKDQPKSPPSNRNSTETPNVVLRRTYSFENDEKFKLRYMELQERIKKTRSLCPIPGTPPDTITPTTTTNNNFIITRLGLLPTIQRTDRSNISSNLTNKTNNDYMTHADDDQKLAQLRNNTDLLLSTKIIPNTTVTTPLTRSSSLRTDRWLTNSSSKEPITTTSSLSSSTTTITATNNSSPNRSPTATSPQQLSNSTNQIRRSFVPPVRDEESETQRKAHAKRVRETRRSTQGVTLDEIKSAEQLVKKKNQTTPSNNSVEQQITNNDGGEQTNGTVTTAVTVGGGSTNISNNSTSISATITTGTPTIVSRDTTTGGDSEQNNNNSSMHERRPSWRLRVDNGSKFKLEDATNISSAGTPTVFIRRTGSQSSSVRPSSAPVESTTATNVPSSPPADAIVTLPLRRNSKPLEDKEQDKENDIRNAQATQAVIQRRRRPKRRSTGVVHVDMDEIDPDKQDSNAGGDYDEKSNYQESGSEQSSRTSRLDSDSTLSSSSSSSVPLIRNENGEIDYKKLWEQSQADNERLREKLRKQDDELRDTKQTLEKISNVNNKNSVETDNDKKTLERKLVEMEEELKTSKNSLSLSELEKREKRAMERKLSEMEEELKQMEALKVENQRLKDENGALIRVISKLSK